MSASIAETSFFRTKNRRKPPQAGNTSLMMLQWLQEKISAFVVAAVMPAKVKSSSRFGCKLTTVKRMVLLLIQLPL